VSASDLNEGPGPSGKRERGLPWLTDDQLDEVMADGPTVGDSLLLNVEFDAGVTKPQADRFSQFLGHELLAGAEGGGAWGIAGARVRRVDQVGTHERSAAKSDDLWTDGDIGGLMEAVDHRLGDVEIDEGKRRRYEEIQTKLGHLLAGRQLQREFGGNC
jgi:hypothetical protein